MDAEEYIKVRLQDEIDWYDAKSKWNKRMFHNGRMIEIAAAALIPLLSGEAKDCPALLWIIAGLGVVIAITAGTMALYQFQEHWIKYRTTAESLKKEKFCFLTKVDPYSEDDSLSALVSRCETLISQENTNWAQYMMRPQKEEPKK